MTLENVYCAICGEKTPLDVDHVKIKAETKRMRDRNSLDEYAFCMECAIKQFDEWTDPV